LVALSSVAAPPFIRRAAMASHVVHKDSSKETSSSVQVHLLVNAAKKPGLLPMTGARQWPAAFFRKAAIGEKHCMGIRSEETGASSYIADDL
jgi:hypothetical protein